MPPSKYELIIGDLIETLPIKAKERQFDLLIADPPFGIKFNKSSHEYGAEDYDLYADEFTPEEYYQFSQKWITACYHALKDTGSLYIISGWTNLLPILNALETTDFHMINHAIWQFSWGVYTKRRFVTSHYHILLLAKDETNYIFNYFEPDNGDVLYWPEYNRGNDPDRIKGHPCQLPLLLLEKLVLTSSSPGDLVGDVFSGSGGTILAARRTGRDVVGFELRKEYEPIIRQKAQFGQQVTIPIRKTPLDHFL
ncbi:MAG: DNA-methyltransferase [Candidatus Heimdallarchaeota archaeon]